MINLGVCWPSDWDVFLQNAMRKDIEDKANNPNFDMSQYLQDAYKHPYFVDKKEEIIKVNPYATSAGQSRNVTRGQQGADAYTSVDIPNLVCLLIISENTHQKPTYCN